MALIRYPGSKEKIAKSIYKRFPDNMKYTLWSSANVCEYREPFFGAGAVGFRVLPVLSRKCSVWINDLDADVVALWTSVRDHPVELCNRIADYSPSIDDFYRFRDMDGQATGTVVDRGFRKLALHRISFSGLGFKAGGPIGGRDQGSARYRVDCRWSPERIKRDVVKLSKLMRSFARFRITNEDFSVLVDDTSNQSFIYADPPYYEKGPGLYKHSMSDDDHRRLANSLASTGSAWVLSYDDHEFIRRLYDPWAKVEYVEITYTTAVRKGPASRKNREVLISPLSFASGRPQTQQMEDATCAAT